MLPVSPLDMALSAPPSSYRTWYQTSPFSPWPQHTEQPAPSPHPSGTGKHKRHRGSDHTSSWQDDAPGTHSKCLGLEHWARPREEATAALLQAGAGSQQQHISRTCPPPRFAPHLGYCAIPPMQLFICPLSASHKKGLSLTSRLLAHRVPQGQEGD